MSGCRSAVARPCVLRCLVPPTAPMTSHVLIFTFLLLNGPGLFSLLMSSHEVVIHDIHTQEPRSQVTKRAVLRKQLRAARINTC